MKTRNLVEQVIKTDAKRVFETLSEEDKKQLEEKIKRKRKVGDNVDESNQPLYRLTGGLQMCPVRRK